MEQEKITLEQVERLRSLADVSYADAKAALEAADGELLNALIWLEQEGKIPAAGVSGYSTRTQEGAGGPSAASGRVDGASAAARSAEQEEARRREYEQRKEQARTAWRTIRHWLVDNRLEAYHRPSGRELQIPVLVALVLLVLAFWLVPVLLIAGYFLGWRYRLAGPDLGREDVNQVMDNINDTAGDVVTSVKKNLFEKK